MKLTTTPLKDCYIIEPEVFVDKRGWFLESYNKKKLEDAIRDTIEFVQDNQSYSKKDVLRGLHFQTGAYRQAKLVCVQKGSLQDVCVDLRKESPTYGEHFSIELNADNRKQLFVPRGFAHGFLVLSEEAIVSYKCDNYYNKDSESGIIYNDPTLNIQWNLNGRRPILSEKDARLPLFEP